MSATVLDFPGRYLMIKSYSAKSSAQRACRAFKAFEDIKYYHVLRDLNSVIEKKANRIA